MADDFGKLLARLSVGVLLLFHGVHKLLLGIDPVKHMVTDHRLPEALSYGVYLGEVVGPALVIFGFLSRVGGVFIAANMAVAVYLAQLHSLFAINGQGGYALELETFYLLGGVCVALSGAGRISVGGRDGLLN